MDGRGPLFADRVATGCVVDGHGDLLADDIYCLPDGPRILDCIEFDDRLRFLDRLDDAAFLAMDLEYLGAPELADRYLDWYLEFAADPAPVPLRHHFIAYRAYVRAKVACLRSAQGDPDAAAEARRHAELAAIHLRAGRVTLTIVGGLPGTGKSTLSAAIADHHGATVISSDRVRKEIAGLDPEHAAAAPFGEGIYTTEWTQRTYAAVLHRAAILLERGEHVVLDASWSSERHRASARELARADTQHTDRDVLRRGRRGYRATPGGPPARPLRRRRVGRGPDGHHDGPMAAGPGRQHRRRPGRHGPPLIHSGRVRRRLGRDFWPSRSMLATGHRRYIGHRRR